MGAALAHTLELPNKIDLAREQYFIVQQIYAGWNRLAFLLLIEAGSLVVLAINTSSMTRWLVLGAIACLVAAQAVFWIFTYPANVATSNWTTVPDNWLTLRTQWEYSHLAGAVFQTMCMSFLIAAVLTE